MVNIMLYVKWKFTLKIGSGIADYRQTMRKHHYSQPMWETLCFLQSSGRDSPLRHGSFQNWGKKKGGSKRGRDGDCEFYPVRLLMYNLRTETTPWVRWDITSITESSFIPQTASIISVFYWLTEMCDSHSHIYMLTFISPLRIRPINASE